MAPDARPALARVQSQAVTRASLPGRRPALCVPSLFLIVSKLLHRTCIFLTHSKVKSATSQVHALPLDPVPCFQPSSCPGLRLGPRSLPSPRDFGRAPPERGAPLLCALSSRARIHNPVSLASTRALRVPFLCPGHSSSLLTWTIPE